VRKRILGAFPESLSRSAEESLRRIGVSVRTNALVTRVTPDGVWLGDEQIRARTVLWTAGVAATPLTGTSGAARPRRSRRRRAGPVDPGSSRGLGHRRYVRVRASDGRAAAGVAQVAIQQGVVVATRAAQAEPSAHPRLSTTVGSMGRRRHSFMADDVRVRACAVVAVACRRATEALWPRGVAGVAAGAHHFPDRLP